MNTRHYAKCIVLLVSVFLLVTTALNAQAQLQPAKETLEVQELMNLLAEYPDDPQVHYELGILLAQQNRREEALKHFEQAILLRPRDLVYSNDYRTTCTWWKDYDRSIEFFEDLVDRHEDSLALRLQLALAYVDKMPSARLGIVGQGILSNKSIKQLTLVIDKDPANWAAWYARAMNHLHWPRAMRHAPQSIEDFKQAIKLQDSMGYSHPRRYFELGYIGLGDALVKDKKHDEARKVWQKGLDLFPKSSRLRKRLSLNDNEKLEEYMEQARSLKKQIDTDLSILWAP